MGKEQKAEAMLNPPISNVGIKGFYRTAGELEKWPKQFNEKQLRMVLFNIYIFIEVGGTGGGCFRCMYSRFLKESYQTAGNYAMKTASDLIFESGRLFTEISLLFKDIESSGNLTHKIKSAAEKLRQAAVIEEKASKIFRITKYRSSKPGQKNCSNKSITNLK
ncbi:MAG TPA: DUF4872 domain-containing protein [Bacteroidales bacterium]|nr:DUF4872 domain-containing protein [Bacteroidales bacterium]